MGVGTIAFRRMSAAAALAAICLLSGCNLNKLMANGAAGLTKAAAPRLEGYWDPLLAMDGTPSALMQLEAMLAVSPENQDLLVELAKAYVGYGYAVVEFGVERLDAEGELEAADRQRHRARLLYGRARDLCVRALAVEDGQIREALKGGEQPLLAHLAEVYPDPQDLAPVFWASIAWGSLINMSGAFPDILADLPLAKAMATHVSQVAPAYGHGAALAFLGGFECGFPALLGGSIERGSAHFERALKLTGRRFHTIQLQYARQCALNAYDRELYVKLLTEIVHSSDQGNDVRLANKIARHRAEWYLSRLQEEF